MPDPMGYHKNISELPVIAIVLALTLIVLIGVVVFVRRWKEEFPETDYWVFFILGISWLPFGIATENLVYWLRSRSF